MALAQHVIERLLLAKDLLGRIRFSGVPRSDRQTLASHILTAHDAAELALAAVVRHLGRLPKSAQTYLMDYFPAIRAGHPEREVDGRDYFNQLNRVRTNIKHYGIFPDPHQWYRVGENAYSYVSGWCEEYLGLPLDELDEASLIGNEDVKRHYDNAMVAYRDNNPRSVLEHLALAAHSLFLDNSALRGLQAGVAKAEDAIKLSAFGVNGNDYLTLQEFLPRVVETADGEPSLKWNQARFGHPGNWHDSAAQFCLTTFVSIALRIQHAEWIPGAIDFDLLYEHKIEAITDGVELWSDRQTGPFSPTDRIVVRTLNRGESIRCRVTPSQPSGLLGLLDNEQKEPTFSLVSLDGPLFAHVRTADVRVTCVPRQSDFVREYYPNLPEVENEQ
jgi:hypothetical protein